MTDRSKPPPGWGTTTEGDYPGGMPHLFGPGVCSLEQAWAWHERYIGGAEARGYARCQADVVAFLSHLADRYHANESYTEFNVRVVQIETTRNSLAAIARGAHVGAAERAKGESE